MIRKVDSVVCDYGLYEDGELKLICNNRRNALLVKAILDKDDMCNHGEYVFSIVLDYDIRQDINGYEYRQTDEYKERKVAREKEEKELNTKAKYMVKKFDKIDKHNRLELINWLDEFQPLSDHIAVHFDKFHIISELNKAGYYAGMNCNTDDFIISTTDEFADWLIGQCIDGLEHIGAIHQVVHKFADEYREKVK